MWIYLSGVVIALLLIIRLLSKSEVEGEGYVVAYLFSLFSWSFIVLYIVYKKIEKTENFSRKKE